MFIHAMVTMLRHIQVYVLKSQRPVNYGHLRDHITEAVFPDTVLQQLVWSVVKTFVSGE